MYGLVSRAAGIGQFSVPVALALLMIGGSPLGLGPTEAPLPRAHAYLPPSPGGVLGSVPSTGAYERPTTYLRGIAPPGPSGNVAPSRSARPLGPAISPAISVQSPVNISPLYPQESDAGLTYDSADHYALLYTAICCGPDPGHAQFTWAINGSSARLVPTPTSPPILSYYGETLLTDDPHDGYVVLVGGVNDSGNVTNQTWAYHAGKWTQLHPKSSPPSNVSGVSAYDPAIGAIVHLDWTYHYNSTSGNTTYSNQTWTFAGGNWTEVLNRTPAGFPASQMSLAYDAADGYLMGYGGYAGNATWKYQNSSWTRIAATGSPPAYNISKIAYDSSLGKVLLFGGAFPVKGVWNNATWGYSAGHWAALTGYYLNAPVFITPTAPNGTLVAYIPPGRSVSPNSSTLSTIWILQNSTWVSPAGMPRSPGPRCCGQSTYDAADGYFLTFGGVIYNGLYSYITLNDTWAFRNGTWTQIHPTVSPPGMYYGSMAYDPVDRYTVFLGGAFGSPYYSVRDQTWTYAAGKWNQLSPSRAPDAPIKGCMAWDTADGYLVYWGGINSTGDVNQTWKFLHGNWSRLNTTGTPPASDGCELAYDDHDGYLLLWTASYSWEYSSGSWTNVSSATGPQFRKQPFFAFDPLLGGVILYGGTSGGIPAREDLWLFSGGSWSQLRLGLNPSWAGYGGCAYDPQIDALVLFVGEANFGWTSQVWTLNLTEPLSAGSITVTPGLLDLGGAARIRADPTGGTGSYTMNWSSLPPGCTGGNSTIFVCFPTQAGNWSINLTVRDSSGRSVKAATVNLFVAPDPSIPSISASPALIDVGMTTTLSATESGGTAPLTYSWSGLPAGCSSSNTRSLSCTPTAAGNFSVTIGVVDQIGYAAYNSTLLTVDAQLAITALRSSSSTLDLGQTVFLSTGAAGGTGAHSFTWTGLPSGCSGSNSTSIVCTPTATGNYSVGIRVSDRLGEVAIGGPIGLVVNPPATTPAISLNRTIADANQQILAIATPSGGTAPYRYLWSTNLSGCSPLTAAKVACAPSGPGVYLLQVTVIDAVNVTTASAAANVSVLPDPIVSTVMANRSSVDVGQSVNFSVSAASGAGGFSYAWSGLPTGCTGAAVAPYLDCRPTAADSSAQISVNVTDANGFSVSTGALAYTVFADPSVAPPIASRTSSDVGQWVTFIGSASPGSGADLYAWSGACPGAAPVTQCRPNVAGALGEQIVVTDSNGVSATASIAYTVYPTPSVSAPTPTRTSLDVGQSVVLTTSFVALGSGRPAIFWSSAGSLLNCAQQSPTSTSCTGTTAGTATVQATVIDSNGGSANVSSVNITVLADPVAGLPQLGPTLIEVGQSTEMRVPVTGGSGGYQFNWSGLPPGCVPGLQNLTCAPTRAGDYTILIIVSDSNGFAVRTPLETFHVDPALGGTGDIGGNQTLPVGGTLNGTAHGLGGSGTYHYDWSFGDGFAGSGVSVRHTYTLAGTFEVTLWINDSIGGVHSMSWTVRVSANAAPGSARILGMPPWAAALLFLELAVAAAAAIGFVLYRGRRGRVEPSEEPSTVPDDPPAYSDPPETVEDAAPAEPEDGTG